LILFVTRAALYAVYWHSDRRPSIRTILACQIRNVCPPLLVADILSPHGCFVGHDLLWGSVILQRPRAKPSFRKRSNFSLTRLYPSPLFQFSEVGRHFDFFLPSLFSLQISPCFANPSVPFPERRLFLPSMHPRAARLRSAAFATLTLSGPFCSFLNNSPLFFPSSSFDGHYSDKHCHSPFFASFFFWRPKKSRLTRCPRSFYSSTTFVRTPPFRRFQTYGSPFTASMRPNRAFRS